MPATVPARAGFEGGAGMRLTEFELLEVVSEDGRRLGHVFDLRAHGRPTRNSPGATGPVEELLYGTLGLLERLGVRKAVGTTLAWDDVISIRAGKIIVSVKPGEN